MASPLLPGDPVVRVLVIDVGGTHVKVAGSWDQEIHKIPSGPSMTAAAMVEGVLALTKAWKYDVVSLGYPGPVKDNRPMREPVNIADGWTTLDFQKAFGKPVRIINDAAMQALGSYSGGRMLFLGLGTGLGTSIVDDWRVEPLEIAHLPYRKEKSYEEYLGEAGLARMGDERWEKHVHNVCDLFRAALLCDGIVLGGGNARKLVNLPDATTRGSNENAILGGIRLWERVAESTAPEFADARTAAEARRSSARRARSASRKKAAKKAGKKAAAKKRAGPKTRAGTTASMKRASAQKSSGGKVPARKSVTTPGSSRQKTSRRPRA
jgi:polyphosphate glucokinase